MAEDNFKHYLVALLLFVAFSWLIISVAVNYGAQYNVTSDTIGGGALNYSLFQSSAENVSEISETYRNRFDSGNVNDVDDATGIFKIAGDMVKLLVMPFTLLSNVLQDILHIPAFLVNIILGLLGIGLLLAIWRVLRTGS